MTDENRPGERTPGKDSPAGGLKAAAGRLIAGAESNPRLSPLLANMREKREMRREQARLDAENRRAALENARIVSVAGQPCAIGLSWSEKRPPPLSGPPMLVGWRGLWAPAPDPFFGGIAPLAPVIALAVENTLFGEQPAPQPLAVIYSDPGENIWWATVFMDGRPASGPELLFADGDGIVAWIEQEASELGGLVIAGDLEPQLALQKPILTLDRRDIRPVADQPEFTRRAGPVVTRFAAAACAAALIGAGGWAGYRMINPPQAPVDEIPMIAWEQELEPFVLTCHAHLRGYWPRPAGYVLERAGCVAEGMSDDSVPAHRQPQDGDSGAAYHLFQLDSRYDGVLARAAARILYADFDGEAEISDKRILLSRSFPLSQRPSGSRPRAGSADFQQAAERVFIGLGDVETEGGGRVRLRSQAGLATLLRRLLELDAEMPASLATLRRSGTNGAGALLVIEPRRRVMRPAEL